MPKHPPQSSKDAVFAQRLTEWQAQLLLLSADYVLPVTTPIAKRWGQISAKMGRTDADVLIAAAALEHGVTLLHAMRSIMCLLGGRIVSHGQPA